MKRSLPIKNCSLVFAFSSAVLLAQLPAVAQPGRMEVIQVFSPSLKGNLLNDSATRNVTLYLPSAYDESPDQRFPVVYPLHGYLANNMVWTGTFSVADQGIVDIDEDLKKLNIMRIADELIAKGRIRPMIIVGPDGGNAYGGSFYANSPVTGNWADFITQDLVRHIDKHYRTIPDRNARAIVGHSMGGHGAIRLAMKHPKVYCALYAMAPAWIDFAQVLEGPPREHIIAAAAATRRDAFAGLFWKSRGAIAMAAAIAPNPNAEPFYGELPLDAQGNRVKALWNKWFEQDLTTTMLSKYRENLRKYKAIAIDCGTQDELLPMSQSFSRALTEAGVEHTFRTFEGNHTNRIASQLAEEVLPLFSKILAFENPD